MILNLLQQTDSKMDKMNARLQVIQRSLDDDAELRQAREQYDQAKSIYAASEEAMQKAEMIANEHQLKISQMEASLYSGSLHNPKELQDIQNDVASLKRFYITLEDRQINAMQAYESAELSMRSAHTNLQKIEILTYEKNNGLIEERNRLSREMENLSAERQAIVSGISPQSLTTYETLRKQHRGIAVSQIYDNSCSACGSNLPPAFIQNIHTSTGFVLCPTCGRILYGG